MFGAGRVFVADQMLQQTVGQVFQIVQPFTQIGVGDLAHAQARVLMHLLHGRFGGQARTNGLADTPDPAGVVGEHAEGFQHFAMLAAGQVLGFQQFVEIAAQPIQALLQALRFRIGIFGHQMPDHDPGVVHHRLADADAGIQAHAFQAHRQQRVAIDRRQLAAFNQFARRNQLGQDHGHGFERFDLFVGVMAAALVLDHQNADDTAAAHDRHTDQRVVDFFARFRPVGEHRMGLRVGQRQRPRMGGDVADQTFADAQTRLVHGFGQQTFGGEKFEHFARAHHVTGADFRHHIDGDQLDHLFRRSCAVPPPAMTSRRRPSSRRETGMAPVAFMAAGFS